ncbi:MAG: hypothetical protein K0R53_956 [Burkholderiales bacterium]|nr:hypothetical protein [Burkholderiales bacterium]
MNDPGGRERLAQLGIRKIPVIAKGANYVFGQNLEDVAQFVGLSGTGHTPLPPAELVSRWITVLRAAQRYVRQLPDERLGERVIPNRDRAIRLLAHHVFRIGEAFVETMNEGKEYAEYHAQQPPAEGTMLSTAEIAAYGEGVTQRIEQWWRGMKDTTAQQQVKTYYGDQPLHELLERSTWHSAQHGRQLMAVLERYGIRPDGPLTAQQLSGLPLPERLWE